MEDKRIPVLSDVMAENATGFKRGDKVKTVKMVGSGSVGEVTNVFGPLYNVESGEEMYVIMAKFKDSRELACRPQDLKKI